MSNTSVWEDQSQSGDLSRAEFMLFSVGYLLLGLVAAGWVSSVSASEWVVKGVYQGPHIVILGIVTFIVMMLAILVVLSASSSFVKFLAYVVMAGSYGIILGPIAALIAGATLVKALVVTGFITLICGVIGIAIPESLGSWFSKLLGATLFVLVGLFGLPVIGWFFPSFPVKEGLSLLDWVTIVIFCGWIIHDMNRAKFVRPTMGNSILVAMDMELNVMNIFVRVLLKYADFNGDDTTYSGDGDDWHRAESPADAPDSADD